MEPIAIVGLGCLFPGAGSPAAFWDNLVEGRDTASVATAEEMGVDPSVFHHPEKGRRDRCYELRGGFVREFRFDPAGYRLPPERLAGLDPVFTWPIEVGRQALADSGHLGRPEALRRCGLVLGNLSFPTRASHRLVAPLYRRALETGLARALGPGSDPRLDPLPRSSRTDPVNGLVSGYPAALAALALGLGGAHHALDAACASSFYALRLACDRLASGEADIMLAGAVSCADPFFIHMGFSIFQAYPQQGRSRPLDRRSGGLLSGEGAGMVALKRYDDARRDGDRVYAVVRGIGLSNDGAGRHPLVPDAAGQRLAFERAYRSAGLPPSTIQYVECHATGTPVGDVTELNAMESFFGPCGHAPRIGSVKSNFGHLLTAAGMASLLKTTLSMHHGLIPPTLHVEDPVVSEGGLFGGETMVMEPTRWPAVPGPRRAGASAFGFGGTNAHVVIERPEPAGAAEPLPPRVEAGARRAPRLSIVGMDAHFGRFDGIAAVEAALHGAVPPEPPRPGRWNGLEAEPELLRELGLPSGAAPSGAYLDGFELDFLRARIPPDSTDRPLPQQLLFLKVADGAIRDAGLERGANVAVIAAMGAEPALHRFRGRVDLGWQLPRLLEREGIALEPAERERLEERLKSCVHDPAQLNQYVGFIGNVMACRVAILWDFHGPAFTVSADEGSFTRALEAAGSLLAAGEVEAVVVGAVDLAGGPEAVLARAGAAAVDPDGGRAGHDPMGAGWMVGEGAGAIVLRRPGDAERAGARVHAIVEAVAHAQSPSDRFVPGMATSPCADAVAGAAREALAAAGVGPDELGYLEMCASGIAARDAAEATGLAEVYRSDGPDPTCAAGSATGTLGHVGAASGVAGLLHAVLCLRGRHLAGFPRWSGPSDPEVWERSAFYVPDAPRPWLVRGGARRLAGVSVLAADGVAAHVVLSEGTPPPLRATALARLAPLRLLPVGAADAAGLLRSLGELEGRIAGGASLEETAASLHAAYDAAREAPLAAALLAGSTEEALREVRLAGKGIPDALARGGAWETPIGSCFAARPAGHGGEVAVVYPGAYSAYPGLGRDLLQIFPSLHDRETSRVTDPARALSERWLHPRRLRPQSEAEREAARRALHAEPVAMMQAAIGFGVLATAVLRDHLGVRPAAAFGYSMGESSMLWAMGVWRDAEAGGERLRRSPLFARRLAGACETAREYLGLPAGTRDFWSSWVVAAPSAVVRERLRGEPRVFLAHVNTPGEVVISGATADVERVVRDLGCDALPTTFTTAVHCEAIRADEEALREFHLFEAHPVPGVRFYSAAENAPTVLERERLARNLARAVCRPVDFPRLVERVWNDGARVFVEPGPGAGCSRWIGEILSDRPHVVVPLNRRGVDDATSLLRAAARLVAHRVPLDLSALRPASRASTAAAAPARSLVRTISVGGRTMVPALEPELVALLRSRRAPAPAPPMSMPLRLPWEARPATGPSPRRQVPRQGATRGC